MSCCACTSDVLRVVRSGSIASVERCRHVGNSGRMAATQQTDASGQEETYPPPHSQGISVASS